ncbi:hypothetical protein B0J12DRAFT_770701 [Macrophomina phaseolina]|uniref:Uncharacterized protein n=1 Tax=Macrophomina phaseolina TaxID=35725 RepID=A0ABQ8FUX1_9PEZI|nr:hypothetical protein B0J12DRAFT_770701 [Macrophomina phaseolina]
MLAGIPFGLARQQQQQQLACGSWAGLKSWPRRHGVQLHWHCAALPSRTAGGAAPGGATPRPPASASQPAAATTAARSPGSCRTWARSVSPRPESTAFEAARKSVRRLFPCAHLRAQLFPAAHPPFELARASREGSTLPSPPTTARFRITPDRNRRLWRNPNAHSPACLLPWINHLHTAHATVHPPSPPAEREPLRLCIVECRPMAACRKAVLSPTPTDPTIHASLSPLGPARLRQSAVSSPSPTSARILAPNFYTPAHLPLRLLVQISPALHWSKSLGRHTFVQCYAVLPVSSPLPEAKVAPHDRVARPACAIFRPVAAVSDVQ